MFRISKHCCDNFDPEIDAKMVHVNTTKKLLRYGITCVLGVLGFAAAHAQGAGNAINFPGTTAFEHVNLGDSLSNKLDTASFTVEMWINLNNSTNGDPAFIGNKDWNSGANTGFAWALYDATHIRFNFKPNGGTRRDYNMAVPKLQGNWNHIAMVVDRHGMLTGYVNGVQNGSPINISSDSVRSVDGILPVRLGQDGTGTYNYNGVSRFNGRIDEVRIWKSVRTQAEIRDNMCHKLTGSEAGLMAYYPLNETTGTTVNNNATAYATVFNGTFQNSPVRFLSSAPIGDTSVNTYPASFTGVVLAMASASHGVVTAQNIAGSMKGLHIYRIDAAPNTYGTIPNPNANSVYYGVFPADTATTGAYGLQYDYTNFPAANTYEQGIDIYKRATLDSAWAVSYAAKNTTANTLSLTGLNTTQELIIGNFMNPATCNTPTSLAATNVTTNSATLGWISGGSNHWNIEYGTGNFTQGTGTRVNNLGAITYALTGLTPNTTYKFYVQDSCANLNGSSAWAGPYTFTTLIDYSAYGSGYAMNFPGTAANEHVNLGTALSATLDTVNYTMEMWVNFAKFNDDETFIANKNWNNGANIGFAFGHSNKSGFPLNTLWFNLQPVNGIRRDWHITLPGLNLINHWNHVAVSINRKGNIAFYINGIPATVVGYAQGGTNSWTTTNMDISVDSNKSTKGTLAVRLGQDGTGTYGVKFKGGLDEVRIWKTVRTQEEIRNNMCRKVAVGDTNLIAYYRLDEPTGTVANNRATVTTGSFNGALTNNPLHVVSGAPIGDTSTYVYGTALSGTTVQLASAQNGKLIIDSLNSTYSGVQIYRLDTIPNTSFDIANLGSNKVYYGVFPIDTAAPSAGSNLAQTQSSYRLRYDYSNYSNATANSANLHLYNRAAGDVMMWTDFGAINQTATSQMIANGLQTRKEVILADFNTLSCANVTNVHTDSLVSTFARIAWTSNGNNFNVQYGPQGFALGQGIIDTVTAAKDGLDSLTGDSWYDVYVRNHCSATDSGKWVGPFTFHTPDACPAPTGLQVQYLGGDSVLISWPNNGASSWNLEWAQQGFTLGSGIAVTDLTTNSYVLTGLSSTMSFDVYLQDTCLNAGKSKWFGPVTFQANGTTPPPPPTSVGNATANSFKVYPNPAQQFINIETVANGQAATFELINVQGSVVRKVIVKENSCQMNLADLPNGLYLLKCSNGNAKQTFKIIVQK